MADEENSSSSAEEIISLEELVKEGAPSVAGAPVPSASAEEVVPVPAEALNEIDAALSEVDPEFAASMQEMQKQAIRGDGADSFDLEDVTLENGTGWRSRWRRMRTFVSGHFKRRVWSVSDLIHRSRTSFLHFAKVGGKAALVKGKAGAIAVFAGAKTTAQSAIHLPLKSKLLVVAALALAVGLFFVLRITFSGPIMPRLETDYLISFAPLADAQFTYGPDEPMEDFNNPLLHPEHVVLIERLIVNLRPGQTSNPMGVFELYVETATQDGVVEIKDREVEARDVISRTLEQMPYDELVNPSGKNKLKIILRKNLNEFLTKGRVRRVYFKTIVLKP